MADLMEVLPRFNTQPWRHLTYSLEKKNISTAELISQDPVEIARKCPLPLREVKRMAAAVHAAIRTDIASAHVLSYPRSNKDYEEPPSKRRRKTARGVLKTDLTFVRTLDTDIDACLGGGFPTGHICEIVGESAVGKTQFVLSLLLTAQLPAPKGLGKSVIYLSTEDELNTSRLHQILQCNPEYRDLSEAVRPSLDRVFTLSTHDFDQQEHIIQYKLPSLVEQKNVGLIVMDSVAANFRVAFPGAAPAVLARRAVALAKLGNVLRKIAHEQNVAVVITNQVADRFEESRIIPGKFRVTSLTPSSSTITGPATQVPSLQHSAKVAAASPPASSPQAKKDVVMSLDYQQCFFTGWGNDPDKPFEALKNPALGLMWVNQLDARIVLKIVHAVKPTATENIYSDHTRRRYLRVVFAPWTPPTTMPVEYELCMQGPCSMPLANGQSYSLPEGFDEDDGEELEAGEKESDEIREMLDPKYWENDPDGDDEFP